MTPDPLYSSARSLPKEEWELWTSHIDDTEDVYKLLLIFIQASRPEIKEKASYFRSKLVEKFSPLVAVEFINFYDLNAEAQ